VLATGAAFVALGLVPAVAGATTLSPADASAMSLTFTGQTGANAWSANPLTVTASATTTDSTNPVYETSCSVDQGAATTVLGSQERVPVSGNGAHIVECYPTAWDGTQGAAQFTTVQIDDQIPAVVLAGAASSPTWHSGSQTVTADASESQDLSGIQNVTCLDGAGNTTVTPGSVGSITVAGTQRYSVSCYATTNAGVAGARTYEQVWMDNTAPTVTFTNAPDPTQWYNAGQPVSIDVQTPAAAAPIASLTCDYNGQAILPGGQLTEQAPSALHNWSVQVTLPSTDSGAINCFATDGAGNVSTSVTTRQRVDTAAPNGVLVKNPTNPDVIVAKVSDGLSGVYGANIQYEQHRKWVTLPTVLHGGTAKAVIPANNPITPGKHDLRVVVTDNADNTFDGTKYQNGRTAVLDYPVAAALHLLYSVAPSGTDVYGHPAANTDSNANLRLAFGQSAQIKGRLYSTARSLIAKQVVTIKVTLADGQYYVVRERTSKTGDWSYRLPAGGDRSVKITYAGSVGLAAQTHTMTVLNQAAVKLAINPMKYGLWTIVGARVLGGSLPSKGLTVIVQWRRNANSPWVRFSHLRPTGANGVVRVGVPVPNVPAGTHVQIRAVVPAAHGWAYAGASSSILDEVVR
jgi:hypothetical protein